MNPILFLLILFLPPSHLYSSDKNPGWVTKRPLSEDYYIGIGVARKDENCDYLQKAKDRALSDLASGITVNISGKMIDIMVEQSGLLKEEVRREINTFTKAELEGYELVDTWESDREYWVYYKLSRALYRAQKQKRIDNAVNLSLDLFTNGRNEEEDDNYSRALMFYLQALEPIQEYLDEPLEVDLGGVKVYLRNEIYSSIQTLLSRIELRTGSGEIDAKVGQSLKRVLEVHAVYLKDEGSETAVANLPVKMSFIRGSGELVERLSTDRQGRASCTVSKITSTDRIQMVEAVLDLSGLHSLDSSSVIFRSTVGNLNVPTGRFILNVSGLSVYLECSELNLGEKLDIPYIEPTVKNALSDEGFSFIGDIADADIIIVISAESRRGAEVYDLYTAFVDLTISVLDMESGEEIYKNSLKNVKGIKIDYPQAGLKALENAGKKLKDEILPDMIESIRR